MSGTRFSDIVRLGEVDSTNRYLSEQARAGAEEGLVVVADHQTAGRGRLGRRWESPPGTSLLCSVLLRPSLGPEKLHLAAVAVALSAASACASVAGVEPAVKWPNDLVVGEAKVAGVLAEVVPGPEAAAPLGLVVGVGVNLTWPGPPGAGGTSLVAAGGSTVTADELLEGLLDELEGRRQLLDGALGRARLADEARRRCSTLGRDVLVELAHEEVLGRAVGLTDEGHLVVERDGERQVVVAGDVVHLRPPPGAGRYQA